MGDKNGRTWTNTSGSWLSVFKKSDKIVAIWLLVLAIAVGYYVSSWFNVFNLVEHKPIIQKKTASAAFVVKEGNFGKQHYQVSVQANTTINGKIFGPNDGCRDLMVVDLKFKVNDIKGLKAEISLLEGVESAEVYQNKIVVRRPCVSGQDLSQLWSWEEVWGNVAPVLEKYFQ